MNKNIDDLGTLHGKVLIFGGVYSNLQALEALKQVAEDEQISPENCICTGDIVGYCAQPEATVELFKHWKARSIAGNVEIQLRSGAEDCGCDFRKGSRCDSFSQQWYAFARLKLSQNSLDFMATLPDHISFNYANKQITVVHGSYFNTSEFIFKSTAWSRKQPNFEATKSSIIVAGHCGLPFQHKKEDRLWINPGVIGMPANNGKPSVWYAVLEDSSGNFKVDFRTLNYNYKRANELMINELLPQAYAKTIVTGIWDNTEILPEIESSLQGLETQF